MEKFLFVYNYSSMMATNLSEGGREGKGGNGVCGDLRWCQVVPTMGLTPCWQMFESMGCVGRAMTFAVLEGSG